MRRRLLAIGIATTAVLASTTVEHAAPAGAAVTPIDRFVLEGEPGDYIKGGAHSDRTLTATGTDGRFDGLTGAPSDWVVQLRAPHDTDRFTVGLYEGAGHAPTRPAGTPGLMIVGEGRGCTGSGRFRVDQADYDGAGNLTAFAARVEQHCAGGAPAAFASVAYRATVPVYAHQLSAQALTFPTATAAAPSLMPFQLTNTSTAPLPVTGLAIAGADAAAFHLTIDTCTGVTLAAGASCGAQIAFAPTTYGPHSADLFVSDAATAWAPGAVGERVALSGAGSSPAGSVSRLIIDGELGDYVTGGRDVDAPVAVPGTADARVRLESTPPTSWNVQLTSPTTDRLTPGLYTIPAGGPYGVPGAAQVLVYGDGRACTGASGHIRVDQAQYTADGVIQAFAARFDQQCAHADARLFGTVAWNATVPVYGHRLSAKHLDLSGTGRATLTVTNPTGTALPVYGVDLAGTDAGSFRLGADGCSGATLVAGASCTVVVDLHASGAGDRSATLVVRDAFTSWTPDGGGEDVALTASSVEVQGGELHPLTPARVLDTRDGTGLGGVPHRLTDGETITFPVLGVAGVPASGVTSVVVNLTATDPSRNGWLALHPSGQAWSGSSSVNFPAGGTAPNMAIVAIGADGRIALRNCCGTVDAVVDIVGWFGGVDSGTALGFRAVPPVRALDTRADGAPLGPDETLRLPLAGHVVPSTARAVVVNLTATGGTAATFVTAYPGDREMPLASSLNVGAGETRPNLVTVKLGDDGTIALTNHAGRVHLIVDVVGYYDGSHRPGGLVVSGNPSRLFDTRDDDTPLGAGERAYLDLSDDDGCVNVEAVVMNVTATEATASSYLTVYPDSDGVPLASNLNVTAGQTIANLVMVQVPDDGIVWFYNHAGQVHVVADLVGVVTRSTPSSPACAGGFDGVAAGASPAAATARPTGLVRVGFDAH